MQTLAEVPSERGASNTINKYNNKSTTCCLFVAQLVAQQILNKSK